MTAAAPDAGPGRVLLARARARGGRDVSPLPAPGRPAGAAGDHAEQALAELTGGPDAAAVLDMTMPGLDPRQIRRALRTPVIFLVAGPGTRSGSTELA